MKEPMYDEWTKPRIKKIEDIFGKNWFINRNVLDVGCNYGAFGEHFLKLGANVTFTDWNESYLEAIKVIVNTNYDMEAETLLIDQNKPYELEGRYDLAIHCGVLYCLSNWKDSLTNTLRNSEHMVLETAIDPLGDRNLVNSFTEEEVEGHLRDLGCKFLKICDPALNAYGRYHWKDGYAFQKYDWIKSDFIGNPAGQPNAHGYVVIPRRMWLVMK